MVPLRKCLLRVFILVNFRLSMQMLIFVCRDSSCSTSSGYCNCVIGFCCSPFPICYLLTNTCNIFVFFHKLFMEKKSITLLLLFTTAAKPPMLQCDTYNCLVIHNRDVQMDSVNLPSALSSMVNGFFYL